MGAVLLTRHLETLADVMLMLPEIVPNTECRAESFIHAATAGLSLPGGLIMPALGSGSLLRMAPVWFMVCLT